VKRQEAFDRMRKNRDTAQRRDFIRLTDEMIAESRRQEERWAKEKSHWEEYELKSSVLMQMACMPLMPPDYYDDIIAKLDRLANEYGVKTTKPRPELKVVGGGK